jgi:hypothetical protein
LADPNGIPAWIFHGGNGHGVREHAVVAATNTKRHFWKEFGVFTLDPPMRVFG